MITIEAVKARFNIQLDTLPSFVQSEETPTLLVDA